MAGRNPAGKFAEHKFLLLVIFKQKLIYKWGAGFCGAEVEVPWQQVS